MPSQGEDIRQQVAQFLAAEVALALHLDGSALDVVEVSARVARIRLGGVCAGCPGTIMAVIGGIEQELRRRFPEIEYVEALP
jgi:Fe-S cluster biogenesis protein NfuA